MRTPKQIEMKLPTWGGKRAGAGRKPKKGKAGVSHLARRRFSRSQPAHVTMSTLPGVGFLRAWSLFQAITGALRDSRERFGLRVVHFSVQGNHLHLLVEAEGAESLSRGVQGLAVRIARALNRVASRRGKVFADRYHAHVLGSRREVANALMYILENFRHHLREDVAPRGTDPCSSAAWLTLPLDDFAPVLAPRTWLLQHAADR
jgi:REP element-mobilizing transposase RayT